MDGGRARLGGGAVGDHRHEFGRDAGLPELDGGAQQTGAAGWPATTSPEGLTGRHGPRRREPEKDHGSAPPRAYQSLLGGSSAPPAAIVAAAPPRPGHHGPP
jgi:hypothetical protein